MIYDHHPPLNPNQNLIVRITCPIQQRRRGRGEEVDAGAMDVVFETKAGRTFTIEIGYFDTVLEIKEKIHKYTSIPVTSQTLVFNGQPMSDHLDTEFYEILQGSRVNLLLDPEPPSSPSSPADKPQDDVAGSSLTSVTSPRMMRVMVQPKSASKKIPVEVYPGDNVGQLRKELQKLHSQMNIQLPQEGYFFIFKQNVMDDDRSFRWHDVRHGDTIEIFNGSVTGGL